MTAHTTTTDETQAWTQASNGRDSGQGSSLNLAAVDQGPAGGQSGAPAGSKELGKGVAPAESGSAEATRNQPVASTKGVPDIQVTPAQQAPANVGGRVSHRINPDDRRFILVVTAGVVIAGVVAFAISFVALMEVAAWLGLPWWMHWAVPTFIDLAILVYAASVLVHKARGESTWKSWVMLAAFTGLSVVANVSHALSYQQQAPWQSIVGAVIAGMVPFAIFAATDQLASVAVEDPETRRKEIEAQQRWLAQQARLEQERLEREHERELAREERERRKEEHEAELELRRAQNHARVQAIREGKVSVLTPAEPGPPVQDSPWTHAGTGSRTQASNGRERGQAWDSAQSSNGRPDPAPLEDVAVFINDRAARGEDTNKHDIAERFECAPKTGYRRISQLRQDQPEIFIDGGKA